MVVLMAEATVNGWEIKRRSGPEVRRERLRLWVIYDPNTGEQVAEFRSKQAAVGWCYNNTPKK